jgi:DNA polymerase-3 subunit alpha
VESLGRTSARAGPARQDEVGWTNLVQLSNCGYLVGADRLGPRLDWHDLADHNEGLICVAGGPPGTGLLASYVERSADLGAPAEALVVTRRLLELYEDRLYVSLVFHGSPSEKLVNRGLLSVAQRLELGVVAANAVRFATPEDALAHTVLGAIRQGRRPDGMLSQRDATGGDLPTVALDTVRSQAFLKSPRAMWRLFGTQLPAALLTTVDVA